MNFSDKKKQERHGSCFYDTLKTQGFQEGILDLKEVGRVLIFAVDDVLKVQMVG